MGNNIGTNKDGTAALPNAGNGVAITTGSKNNIIGGDVGVNEAGQLVTADIISGNIRNGISLNIADGTKIFGNLIGISLRGGGSAMKNGGDGIWVFDSCANWLEIGDIQNCFSNNSECPQFLHRFLHNDLTEIGLFSGLLRQNK